ncbi:multidrug resistance-associated protein 5, partial [Tanacetum coccineum]
YERSGEVRVVAKYGQRPLRLSDPEKGKQRKQTKYPSVSSDDLPKCPWRCYARWMINEKTFQCISLVDEHTCVRNFNFGALVNYKWIAKIFGDKIRANPDIRLCDIADLVMKKYKCKVSPNQCTNAKKYALTEYEKTIGEHYSMLRSYGKAILDSNLGSTVKLGVTVSPDGKTYFDSPNQGEILTAIGRDGNNHIYLVAWAVVNVENKENWTWFLELLEQDLGSIRGNGLTLMSDQHKGLIEDVKDVMPNAKHWQSSYPQLFNKIMDKIKSANPNAHKYLMDKNPKTWSRAFFEVDRGCEAIENGFSECFNSVIVNVRHKPLLTMLEAIRVLVLEKMNKMREISRKWNPWVCPNIKKILEWLKEQQRMWQLSGLPCVHATKVIFLINKIPESYVPTWFEIEMYFVAYHNYVKPVPGMNFWPDQSMYSTVLPPKPRKMSGRPKKKRIRAIGEGSSSTRISKRGGDVMSRGGASGSRGGASVSRQVGGGSRGVSSVSGGASGSRGKGASGSGGASGSRGRGAGRFGGASGSRSRDAGGSKRKPVSTDGTQKRQGKKKVGTSDFAKWFGLQDEPEQTQDEPQQTQHEPVVTQDEDQVEQTEDQAEIELTQLEQTKNKLRTKFNHKNNHNKLL